MREAVVDTSPLQYLHQVGLVSLLPTLYDRVLAPEAVAAELAAGARGGHAVPEPHALDWLAIVPVSHGDLLGLVTDLGAGEREVLALVRQHPGAVAILDDALARRHAELLGVPFTGTVGVLLKAKQAGLLDEVRPVLDQLQAVRFRLDASTRAAVLRVAGES